MDVASICPLPLGVIRWSLAEDGAPVRPVLTVVVKGTFALDRDGELALAREQDPISLDRTLELPGFRGLSHASDLVPFKPRADVLLAGHARARAPIAAIPLRIVLGAIDKRVFALAGAPSAKVPLVPAYLRETPSALGDQASVGPCPAWSERVPTVPDLGGDLFLLGADGETLGPLPASFDYGLFNAAPEDQQLPELPMRVGGAETPPNPPRVGGAETPPNPPEGGLLVLEGFFAGAPRREVRLPGVSPRVFLLGPGGAPARDLPLRADTLSVDTDRAVCTVAWRGVTELGGGGEPSLLVLALESSGRPLTFDAVVRDLGRARRYKPVDHAALRAAPPAAGGAPGSVPPPPDESLDEEPTADSTFDELMEADDEPDTVVTKIPPELIDD